MNKTELDFLTDLKVYNPTFAVYLSYNKIFVSQLENDCSILYDLNGGILYRHGPQTITGEKFDKTKFIMNGSLRYYLTILEAVKLFNRRTYKEYGLDPEEVKDKLALIKLGH